MSDTFQRLVSKPRKIAGNPALYVGLVADAPTTPPARISLAGIDRIDIGRGDSRKVERGDADGLRVATVLLADPRMSGRHARIARHGNGWIVEDLQSRNGTWIGSQRVTRKPLIDGETIVVGHTALVFRDDGGDDSDHMGQPAEVLPGIATLSPRMAEALTTLAGLARQSTPILISGPAGSGVEPLAAAIHAASGRGGMFVPVACGSVSGIRIEAELFGHAADAYPGAGPARDGALRAAARGTVLLDDVTELPIAAQDALLKALERGAVVPVGGSEPIPIDVRITAATTRDLDLEVTADRFRSGLRDLLGGPASGRFTLPALRDRLEDLAMIVSALLARHGGGRAITFSGDALGALYAHDWPLNMRELERSLVAALAITDTRIEIGHLPASVGDTESIDDEQQLVPFGGYVPPTAPASAAPPSGPPGPQLSEADRVLRERLSGLIAKHDGNLAAVAREMAKDRTQIRRWMRRFGLTRDNVAATD